MRVGIVGCGLIGVRRAQALRKGDRLVAVADVVFERAQHLAAGFAGCKASADWRSVTDDPDIDLVIAATSHDALVPVSLAAAHARKHLLVEKPGARNVGEIDLLIEASHSSPSRVKIGFNHRFHPALIKAKEIFSSGALGPLLCIRGRYGHGGRLGYEQEWRADSAISGGGELLDQGTHLIDLSRWFAGDFAGVYGHLATFFWKTNVEDNSFVLLETASGQVAWLHASWTEWKNLFSFELFGREGKLQIDGLGGSYGVERLTHYRMLPEMGPPETVCWEYPGADLSWAREYEYFAECIEKGNPIEGGLEDARAALKIVAEVYRQSPKKPGRVR